MATPFAMPMHGQHPLMLYPLPCRREVKIPKQAGQLIKHEDRYLALVAPEYALHRPHHLPHSCQNYASSVSPSVCLSVCLSVRPSVCLSVAHSIHTHTTARQSHLAKDAEVKIIKGIQVLNWRHGVYVPLI